MANFLDRVMRKFMKHIDLEPNKPESEVRQNAQAAGPETTRAAGFHDRTPGNTAPRLQGRAVRHTHSKFSGVFHRGH